MIPAATSVVTVTLNPAIDQTLSIPGFAAGRVNRVVSSRCDAGGKGVNVACVLADLGVETVATGFLGAGNAALFETFLATKDIADRFVRLPGLTRVGIKVVDDRTQETTDINFPGLAPAAGEIAELFERIAALAAAGRWFVLSGSVPPGLPDDVYAGLIEAIHGKGGRVVLDTSGRPLAAAMASRPDVIKPNVEELGGLVGGGLDAPAAVCRAAKTLLKQGIRLVVVSMGGDGAVFVDREHALLARPPKVTVISTVGAGDAMVGGIVYGMIHDLPLEEVARTATASGAYAVTRVGSGIEDPAEFRALTRRVEIEPLA
ncbi:MAG TPA: 1-phosphofructokinase [Thermoanaerobaculia bacterium]|nr:1-phosphofructokinase [Thermoanaerobaculia bacterium]